MIFKISIILLTLGQLAWAGAGTIDSGGGFSYYRSPIFSHLMMAKHSLINNLRSAPEILNKDIFGGRVDLQELAQIIARMEVDLGSPIQTRKNPHGYDDVLMMDYRFNEQGDKYIVVLRPFFEKVEHLMGQSKQYNEFGKPIFYEKFLLPYMRRRLLHEALHHFGFDEHESFVLSQLENGLMSFESESAEFCKNESCSYFWSKKYKNILHELSLWGRLFGPEASQYKIEMQVSHNLTLILNTHDNDLEARLINKSYKSTLYADCEMFKTELGSVLCKFHDRIDSRGRLRDALSKEGVEMVIRNPLYENSRYLDGHFKELKPLRIQYRHFNEDEYLYNDSYIHAFKIIKESAL